jgi:hypothetical protein
MTPLPLAPSARMGRIFASGAMPAIPTPLPASAAIVPATWVPCPFGSELTPEVLVMRSMPGRT